VKFGSKGQINGIDYILDTIRFLDGKNPTRRSKFGTMISYA